MMRGERAKVTESSRQGLSPSLRPLPLSPSPLSSPRDSGSQSPPHFAGFGMLWVPEARS